MNYTKQVFERKVCNFAARYVNWKREKRCSMFSLLETSVAGETLVSRQEFKSTSAICMQRERKRAIQSHLSNVLFQTYLQ